MKPLLLTLCAILLLTPNVPLLGKASSEQAAEREKLRKIVDSPKSRENADALLAMVASPNRDSRLNGLEGLNNHYCPYLRATDFDSLYAAVKDAVVLPDADGRLNDRLMVEPLATLISDQKQIESLKKDLRSRDKATRLAAAGVLSADGEVSVMGDLVGMGRGADYIERRELSFALYRLKAPIFPMDGTFYSRASAWWKKEKTKFLAEQEAGFSFFKAPAGTHTVETVKKQLLEHVGHLRFTKEFPKFRHYSYDSWFCRTRFYPPPRTEGQVLGLQFLGFATVGGVETAQIVLVSTPSFCPKAMAEAIASRKAWLEAFAKQGFEGAFRTLGDPRFSLDPIIHVPLLGDDGSPNLWFEPSPQCAE